jgi:DNA polymerase III alpha subunit (gram-positive type)
MPDFAEFLNSLDGRVIAVCYPVEFDMGFVNWYMHKFSLGRNPIRLSSIDMRSYAMGMLKVPYARSSKKHLPADWFDESPHNHIAVDDAREQGRTFIRMLKQNMCE